MFKIISKTVHWHKTLFVGILIHYLSFLSFICNYLQKYFPQKYYLSIYLSISLSVCLSIYRICLTYCFPFFSTVPRFFDLASCNFKLTLVVVLISLYTFLSLNWVIKLLQDEALWCSGLILHNLLTDKRGLALFPVGNIVRDPHHCKSLINHKHDLNLRRRFKSCLRHVRDSRWWWSLILISVGNNASRCLSLVNHTTKKINYFGGIWLKNSNKSDESLFLFDKSIFFLDLQYFFSEEKLTSYVLIYRTFFWSIT